MKHFILVSSLIAAATAQYYYSKNQAPLNISNNIVHAVAHNSTAPQKDKWEILFDGKSMDKWRKINNDSMPSAGWIIAHKTLSVQKGQKGGDIITRETYGSFELLFDFKLTEAANSGIKYGVVSIQNSQTKKSSMMGIEYQIIDDDHHPEIKDDPNSAMSTGAAYLLYPPAGKKLLPPGQWNSGKIIVRGKYAEHWLNGVKLTSYTRGTDDFSQKISATKFKDYPDYAKADIGHIMLTDHGDQVYFRNIKIRRL